MPLQKIDSTTRVNRKLCALAIMTKAPEPGKVKTRLVPPLTSSEAAELNVCFLRDVSQSVARACAESSAIGVAVFTPVNAAAVYETILPTDFLLLPQRGEQFGERLRFAVEDLFAAGFASVCLINSDSPSVPSSAFVVAAAILSDSPDQLAIGPADDGGYYLIGMKKLHDRLFQEIDWSTERVFEQTKQRAAEIGLSVKELPFGLDIDDAGALARLGRELLEESKAGEDVAPETRRFLADLVARRGRELIFGQ